MNKKEKNKLLLRKMCTICGFLCNFAPQIKVKPNKRYGTTTRKIQVVSYSSGGNG
jgi:hypothetical protein